MSINSSIDERIRTLDLSLFQSIHSESSSADRRSLLACQRATRNRESPYNYLEIGSHLGGSLQPHIVDPSCGRIYSIDKRPGSMPDERGLRFRYPENTTERMLSALGSIEGAEVDRLTCLDGDANELGADSIADRIHLCFIDGEHTDEAALRDFRFCLNVVDRPGAIVFHDAQIVYNGILEALRGLKASGRAFHAYNLPDCLLVVELDGFALHEDPAIAAWLLDNYQGYLASLRLNDHFRRIANQPLLRAARTLRARFKRQDISGWAR
jgi:Methyltransferase domain